MRIIPILCLSLIAAFSASAAPRHSDGDYVIVLNDNESPDVVKRQHGVGQRPGKDQQWDKNNGFHGFSAHLTGAQADRLENDTRVQIIEPDLSVQALSQTIPTGVRRIGTLSNSVAAIGAFALTSYGGAGSDGGAAVCADSAGNIYAAGWFSGSATFGGTTVTSAGGLDVWITKTSAAGVFQWVKNYGSTGDETPTSLAVDGSGNLFLGGYFTGTANLGGTNMVSTGNQDIFLAKYNSSGVFVWEHGFGGTDLDALYGLAVDSGGNVLITGTFRQTINFGGSTLNSILGGDTGFLAKFNTSGTHQWSERFGGTSSNYGRAIALDASDNAFVTGEFFASIDCGAGSQSAAGSGAALYLSKFNTGGTCTWQVVHGTGNTTKPRALTVDGAGNAIVSGFFNTSTDLGGGTLTSSAVFQDQFVAKYGGSAGAYQWAKVTAGSLLVSPAALAHDSANNVVLTGYWQGTANFGPRSATTQAGGYDIYVETFSAAGVPQELVTAGGTQTDQAYAVAVDASNRIVVTGVFQGTATFDGVPLTSAGSYDAFLFRYHHVNADIAIIDTGIQLTHPDLNVVQNVSFVTNTINGNDDNGHGTHCAGIAAALDNSIGVVGVAPGARLWAVKVLDSTGGGALSTIISGVDYVTQHASQIEVANMSLGGQGASDSLHLAIQNSVASGVVYVVAAGNSAFDVYGNDLIYGTADDFFPAAYDEVATVSALADTDGQSGGIGSASPYGPDDTLATFSNYSLSVTPLNPVVSPGAAIDVAAPGVSILSTYTNSGYMTLSGTSMASPHVAGAAGLYVAKFGRAGNSAGVYTIRQDLINAAEAESNWGINTPSPIPYDPHPEGLVRVDTFSAGIQFPSVVITAPPRDVFTVTSTPLTFTATATDAQDGNIASSLVWLDSLQGVIGHGATFSTNLVAGVHSVTTSVTNSFGLVGRATVAPITISSVLPTLPPVITITCPTNGVTLVATNFPLFTCTVTDANDGDISNKAWWWVSPSNCDGGFCYVGTNTNSVQWANGAGWWTWRVTATNSANLGATNTFAYYVAPDAPNQPPVIVITSPPSGSVFTNGTPIAFAETCIDDINGNWADVVTWTSSINGMFINTNSGWTGSWQRVVTNSSLSVGTHTIMARSVDTGLNGAPPFATNTVMISLTIVTNNLALAALNVTATPNKTAYHKKEKVTIMANVQSGGTNVPSAALTFSFTYRNSASKPTTLYATATTDSNGNGQAIFPIANSAVAGTATAPVVASKLGYQNGTATATFTILQ